jgi:hypothetical protein
MGWSRLPISWHGYRLAVTVRIVRILPTCLVSYAIHAGIMLAELQLGTIVRACRCRSNVSLSLASRLASALYHIALKSHEVVHQASCKGL